MFRPRLKDGAPMPITLEEWYQTVTDTPYSDSGIWRHLPYLRSLVRPGDHVIELGVGGMDQSTGAFLAGKPKCYTGYDLNEPASLSFVRELAEKNDIEFMFVQGDTSVSVPDACDILLIDTLHTYQTVKTELSRFSLLCNRQIVFHDVLSFGRVGQCDQPNTGINLAIAEFLFDHREWRVERMSHDDNGLLTLRRTTLSEN